MRSLENDFENKIHSKLPSGLFYKSLPRPIYIFLSSFQWDQRRRNRLHVPCRGCRDSQSGLWISASRLFHSRGILTTPRLSSSHPENVEVYGYCLVQRMSWLVVQRVLMATAWEYSAFVLKARRNMEVRRGLRIWDQKMKKMPRTATAAAVQTVRDATGSAAQWLLSRCPRESSWGVYGFSFIWEFALIVSLILVIFFWTNNTRYWRIFIIYIGNDQE